MTNRAMRQHEAARGLMRKLAHVPGSMQDKLLSLPDAPDGPRLERWNAQALAEALDQEIARCQIVGWPKITVHMDVADAKRLARVLRKVG